MIREGKVGRGDLPYLEKKLLTYTRGGRGGQSQEADDPHGGGFHWTNKEFGVGGSGEHRGKTR